MAQTLVEVKRDNYDHFNPEKLSFKSKAGVINEELVREISRQKGEPDWMLHMRLKGLNFFLSKPMPNWGPSLDGLNLNEIHFFMTPEAQQSSKWEDVPADIKSTFDKLGIPEAEKRALAGVGAQ